MDNIKAQKFKYLYNVKFNNKEFMVFNNEKIPFYLIEIDHNTGKLKYPEFEDFFQYYNLHNKKNVILEMSDKLDDKNNISSKIFKFTPKVLYKGQVVLLSLALLLSGCGKTTDSKSDKQQLLSQFEQQGIIAEYESYDEEVIFVHEYDCEEFGGKTIFCRNLDELKSYVGDYSPTYDDVINIFKEKSNVKSEYLECIITNLQKMKDAFPGLDLTVLYYNAKRMNFVEVSQEEMNRISGHPDKAACYNMKTAEVFYNPNNTSFDEFTLIHEVLGHGTIDILYKDNNLNKYVYYGFYNTILRNMQNENQNIYYPYSIGSIFVEGAADMIARKTTGKSQDSIYNYGEEMLRLFAEICNMNYSELINSRGVDLYDKLYYVANLNDPVSYAIDADVIYVDYCNNNIKSELSLKTLFERLMIDSATEKVQKSGDEEIKNATQVMTNTYFDDNIELYYYTNVERNEKQVLASYNPNESSKNVEEELSKISKH